jgi:ParB-like chromosome segregation protein Spo0J
VNAVMKIHPVAKMFPTIGAKGAKELREDIEANGIKVPILINKAKDTILDGRNRWMIAHELKLDDGKVPFEVFKGTDEEIPGEIISRNILRRHLTDDQRAFLVAQIRGPQIEADAKARQDLGMKSTQGSSRARDQVAKEANVSDHKARAALTVSKRSADEIKAKVASGEMKLHRAVKKVRKPSKPKREPMLKEIIQRKFTTLMDKFSVAQHRYVRAYLHYLSAPRGSTISEPKGSDYEPNRQPVAA